VQFTDEGPALAFERYLKSGSGASAKRLCGDFRSRGVSNSEQLAVNTEQRLSSGVHERRVGLFVVVLSEFENRVEVVTAPQGIEPWVAHERFVRIEIPVHDLRQDLDGAIEIAGVREADDW
jgi:hypothetical protein